MAQAHSSGADLIVSHLPDVSDHAPLGAGIPWPDLPPLWILRHGQTEWNAEGRMQGWLNSALTETGRAQAAQQGDLLVNEALPDGVRLLASPLGRARQTSEIVASGLGLPIETDDRLKEIGCGPFEGELLTDLVSRHPDVMDGWESGGDWHFRIEGGEGRAAFARRCAALLDSLTGPTILVCHGITGRMIRALALGLNEADMWALPGGQGVVWHLQDGAQRTLGSDLRRTVPLG
ncbi:histidine phosphatase family protein [Tropicimonas sp. IMCC34011]|uniref:histidine phosphatase family protein n=1 Tax=Tropicimonas sp. IMCC34011 TaxID=2248759 RepID=UPI000E277F0A|nr:histidine phosphatase family protein [Tropicimonas sp. IMCC34011]